MKFKNIYFSWLIHWERIKGISHGAAEAGIMLASLFSLFVVIYQLGFVQTTHSLAALAQSRSIVMLVFFLSITLRYIAKSQEVIQEKMLYIDISLYFLLFSSLCSSVFFPERMGNALPYLDFLNKPLFMNLLLICLSIIHLSRQTFTLMQTRIRPSLLFLLSFVFVILIGAGLLSMPTATTHPIAFVDALFISTTSVCVTGLTTIDVATSFTSLGHIIIMILIQIGGIGVMTFTSFFALSFMGSSSFSSKMMLKDMLNEEKTGGLFRVLINILFVTLLIEGIGAYLIFLDVRGSLPGGIQEEIFYAAFHAVSAFCNAGISTLSGNMCDPLVTHKAALHIWISMLIIFGGLGFPIVFNYIKLLHHLLKNGFRMLLGQQKHYIHSPRIINVHTYIVVISTAFLVVGGTLIYYILEAKHTLSGLPWDEQMANAFLGAVTPRTAGFNVVDMATLTPATLMFTLILMTIGAAPMSTGGGMKVTTVFVALATTLNAARKKDQVEVRKRQISTSAIQQAFAIIVLYSLWALIATWVLAYTEPEAPLFSLLFEVVSALSTVGLSINLTPSLTVAGKIVIISTMLIGRIGVLAFLMSFCKERERRNYTYPQENILM